MAATGGTGVITVDVKPNLDRFVQASSDDVMCLLGEKMGTQLDVEVALKATEAILEKYILLPR